MYLYEPYTCEYLFHLLMQGLSSWREQPFALLSWDRPYKKEVKIIEILDVLQVTQNHQFYSDMDAAQC